MSHSLTLTVNGARHAVDIDDPRVTLLDLLRDRLALTGTKKGCDRGQCGACTVLVDGRRVNACLALAVTLDGAAVETIEGLADGDRLHPVQAAFIAHDGFQCGFCTPGQIMSAVGLLREGEGGPLAQLEVAGMAADRRCLRRQAQRDDEFARRQGGFHGRIVAGETKKVLDRHRAPAARTHDLDGGVERDQRHGEVRRMRGDAGLAPSENGVAAVLALAGIAAGTGLTAVAGAGGVEEVRAAGVLQEVATDGGRVADLRRGAGKQGLGHCREGHGEAAVAGEIGVADHRADAGTAVGQQLDRVEPRQAGHVDEPLRARGPGLHQVDEVGAGGEPGGARRGPGGDRLGERGGADVVEAVHAVLRVSPARTRAASATASVMPA